MGASVDVRCDGIDWPAASENCRERLFVCENIFVTMIKMYLFPILRSLLLKGFAVIVCFVFLNGGRLKKKM